MGSFHLPSMILILIGFAVATWLISLSDRKRSELFFAFTIDGMLILIPILAWIGSLL